MEGGHREHETELPNVETGVEVPRSAHPTGRVRSALSQSISATTLVARTADGPSGSNLAGMKACLLQD